MPLMLLAVVVLAGACVHRAPDGASRLPQTCRDVIDAHGNRRASSIMTWRMSQADRARLDDWCATVGPAVVSAGAASEGPPTVELDEIAFVSWNVHAGAGDLGGVIAQARRGAPSGTPARHVVLLVQEARRAGAVIPLETSPDAPVPRAVRSTSRGRHGTDIVADATKLGLHLAYVPMVRNGRAAGVDGPEDRGNAILSTLPLYDVTAMELPLGHQRRVAVAASIAIASSDAVPARSLRVVSLHLDTLATSRTLFLFASPFRARQARAAADLFTGDDRSVVVGADLNTWADGPAEPAVRDLLRALPQTAPPRWTPTFRGLWRLDYLFFRLPSPLRATSHPLASSYGSDHRPVAGWITR